MLRALSLLFHQESQRAEVQQSFSMFQELPNELTVLVMCHTRSSDLVNLIQTEKYMNRIFETHKTWIFKRMQIYQFPEFSGWFGDMPGFDGSTLGTRRTSEQVECLKDQLFSLGWKTGFAANRRDVAAKELLALLERHGGWRYLAFLYDLKCKMERDARKLHKFSYEAIPSMNAQSAMAIVLGFSRISGRTAGGDSCLSFDEMLAALPARVANRLQIFEQQPRTLQSLMITTVRLLVYRMAIGLEMDHSIRNNGQFALGIRLLVWGQHCNAAM